MLGELNDIFGIFVPAATEIPAGIIALARQRDEARKAKDFSRSDEIRNQIVARGYQVKDSPHGTKVVK